jgi:branched-chain amino acid transport system substrate-binding protein
MDSRGFRTARVVIAVLISLTFLGCATSRERTMDEGATARHEGPLKIGLVLDYTGALRNLAAPLERGARLAANQINAAGGVLGMPVEIITADGATDPEVSVSVARDLIDEHSVHALAGPAGSAATLAVATAVSIPARVPLISPSATSPQLTTLDDEGFVFRTVCSDALQGPVLAEMVEAQGFKRVGVLFRNDPYGRGLSDSFTQSFSGTISAAVPVDLTKDSYLEELRQAAAGGTRALVAITFIPEAEVFLKEALDHDLFDAYFLADALGHQFLIDDLGAERLPFVTGTAPRFTQATSQEILGNWIEAYTLAFGEPPTATAQASYDIIMCLSLAAEYARSTDGVAIRDALPLVCGGDDEPLQGGPEATVGEALARARDRRPIDYEGLSSSMDWDAAGDISDGSISIWELRDGTITTVGDRSVSPADSPRGG